MYEANSGDTEISKIKRGPHGLGKMDMASRLRWCGFCSFGVGCFHSLSHSCFFLLCKPFLIWSFFVGSDSCNTPQLFFAFTGIAQADKICSLTANTRTQPQRNTTPFFATELDLLSFCHLQPTGMQAHTTSMNHRGWDSQRAPPSETPCAEGSTMT